jgi:hypothetical protein
LTNWPIIVFISHEKLQVSDFDVPAGILGPKLNGCLYDVKVQSKGPDDAAYNKYPDLR